MNIQNDILNSLIIQTTEQNVHALYIQGKPTSACENILKAYSINSQIVEE